MEVIFNRGKILGSQLEGQDEKFLSSGVPSPSLRANLDDELC